MDDMNKFKEMLADILEVARVQGNRLSKEEMKELFGDIELTDVQYNQISAYLEAELNKSDKEESADENQEENTDPTEEESAIDNLETDMGNRSKSETRKQKEADSIYLKMYLEDLEAIEDSTEEEEQTLLEKIKKGDSIAKNRLIEANLRYVVQIASEYKYKGITLEDIIQEGNMGLLNSIEHIKDLSEKTELKPFITDYVRKAIEEAIDENKDSSSFENKVIEKIRYINDSANELAEDLGRTADVHELAAYTKLSIDEIHSLLNTSSDAVKIEKHHTHTNN